MLSPEGMIPPNKFKFIGNYFPNFSMVLRGILPGNIILAFLHSYMDKPFMGVLKLHLIFMINTDLPMLWTINIAKAFTKTSGPI